MLSIHLIHNLEGSKFIIGVGKDNKNTSNNFQGFKILKFVDESMKNFEKLKNFGVI